MFPKVPPLIPKTVLSILILLMAGCAATLAPSARDETTEYRQKKNYKLGELMSVSVGEPIVVIQDFWLTTQSGGVAVPSKDLDFKGGGPLSMGGPTYVFKKGNRYPIRGTKEVDGVSYSVVATGSDSHWVGLLVRADGTMNTSQMWWQLPAGGALRTALVSDPTVTFEREVLQNVILAKGYENYEILYTGVNASGLNLTYREFSPEGLARVAFFQNLTYEVGVKNISFKKFKIAVESATSEKIVFRVVEDGFSKNAGSSMGK